MANTPVTNGMTVAQMVAIINTIGVQGDNSALSIAELISTMSTKLNAAQVQALIDASSGGGGGSETRESILLKLGISDISGVNTGDQDLTAIISALAGKASQTDFNNLQTAYNAYVTSNNNAVASKVAQSVYDTFVSAYNTAIAAKVDTATYNTNKTNTDAAIAALTPTAFKDINGNYTFILADVKSKGLRSTSGTSATWTIPLNTTAAFAVEDTIQIIQRGAGGVLISPAAGVTLVQIDNKFTTRGPGAVAALQKQALNEWLLIGDLSL